MPLYAQALFEISLDFTSFKHSRNTYPKLTQKYHKNSFAVLSHSSKTTDNQLSASKNIQTLNNFEVKV